MIMFAGTFNDVLPNISQFEVDEKKELSEFLDIYENYLGDDASTPTEHILDSMNKSLEKLNSLEFKNRYERYKIRNDVRNDSKFSTNYHQSSSVKPNEKINFDSLPAITLRRYKKFFKLPNRSGATSRSQLLTGLDDHISSIDPDYLETIANFLHIMKDKNQLEKPL